MAEEDVKDPLPESPEDPFIEKSVKEPEPGEKTDPALLLKSLQEEREKRRVETETRIKVEQELQALKSVSPDALSDEGQLLQKEIGNLKEAIELKDLNTKYPVLLDKATEFQEFRQSYLTISLDKVAKLFLSENDLLEQPKPRKGLESSRGGERIAPKQGLSSEEIENLRNNNYRLYKQKLQAGEFKNI